MTNPNASFHPRADSPQLTEGQRAYHLTEYGKLNVEVADALQMLQRIYLFCATGSAAVFAWVLTIGGHTEFVCPSPIFRLAFCIPLVLAVTLAGLSFATAARIREVGHYLGQLEKALGHPNLGWEAHLRARDTSMSKVGRWAWGALILGNAAVAAGAWRLCGLPV